MPIPPTKPSHDHLTSNKSVDIFGIIRALDTGINNHEEWISKVHESLVCGDIHSNPHDLNDDAHCHCKFGQWIYSSETESISDYDHFQSVVALHKQMHELARNIISKNDDKVDISGNEYRNFTTQAIDFKLHVRNLQYELMNQVCVIDHLTGAWNRYAMYSKLHQEKERLMRAGHATTLCMMDIDHFKQVNDSHGHAVGDQVLKSVIDFCHSSLRTYDSIYRYGGEEFLFCLPDSDVDETRIVIERLCADLAKLPIALPNGEILSVTASFGIAGLSKTVTVEETIQEADHALLCAKARGRDRVCCWVDGLSAYEEEQ